MENKNIQKETIAVEMTAAKNDTLELRILPINSNLMLIFAGTFSDLKITKFSIEGHFIKKLGSFKSINKIAYLEPFKEMISNRDLHLFFKEKLTASGWDFLKYPNITIFKGSKKKR